MGNHVGGTGQDYLYGEQGRRYEQEGKLQGLCDSGEHAGQSCGQQKAACLLFLFRLRALIHGQGCARQTEDHENKLAGEVTGCVCTEVRHVGGISKLGEEDVLAALYQLACHFHGASHCSLPEGHVEYVMQAEGNQRTLDDTEDQGSDVAAAGYQAAQGVDAVLYHRPYEVHGDADEHIYYRRNNRDETRAAEEG